MSSTTPTQEPPSSRSQRLRSRSPRSRPTTPLRPSSRSSLRDSAQRSRNAAPGSNALEGLQDGFAELSDAMADLEQNFVQLQLMHESLARFSESFAGFLYGMNMNAFCVDFPEVCGYCYNSTDRTYASETRRGEEANVHHRPRFRTPSSAHRITPVSIPPPVYRIAALQASKTLTLPFSRLIHRSLTIRQARKQQANSKMPKAQRRAHPRRRLPLRLEGGEAYRQHEEEEGYPRVVVQQEAPPGEAASREDLQEAEEGVQLSALVNLGGSHVKTYRRKRKQYTTDSLSLSNH
jgi:hypothetical protein